MTLVTSGLIRIGQTTDTDNRSIAAEFGGTPPHNLSEYYRGGGLVPDTVTNAGIPVSGPIQLSDFYGASAGAPVAEWSQTVSEIRLGSASAGLRFETDGSVTRLRTTTTSAGGNWFLPNTGSVGNGWRMRATLVSGSAPTLGTLNTILPLTSALTWRYNRSGTGTTTGTLLFEIIALSTVTVVASRQTVFTATVDFG